MGRGSKLSGRTSSQRRGLTRNRVAFHAELRENVRKMLDDLAEVGDDGRPESMVEVVEKLILREHYSLCLRGELPAPKLERHKV